MAKLHGPLLSFRARGQIGKGLVTSSWRGVAYARQYVVPAYTNTGAQALTRNAFAWLNAMYAHMGALQTQPWDLATVGRARTPRNQCIATNLPLLREEVMSDNYLFSPGARGGPAPAGFTAAGGAGSGELDLEIVPSALPTGWTINKVSFAVFESENPQDPFTAAPLEASVAAPGPYTHTFAALAPGSTYQCGGWVIYNRADGTLAASISPISQAVATA